jgi:glycosyltransferase involved in cell wall biosynthesis
MTLEQCWHRVPGGTAVAGIGMARALALRSDVEIIGVAARHPRRPKEPWTPPIEVFELPLPRLLLYPAWHRLRRPRVGLAAGRADVIHATTLAIPPRSAPLVVTIHDLAFIADPSNFTARGLKFFRRGLELAQRDADFVVCPSEATRRDCEGAGFKPDRLRVVPLGVDAHRASESEIARVKTRYALTRPYILWTGTIEPRKNLKGLIQAFASLESDRDLAIAGPSGWHEDLAPLIRGLKGRVKELGFVDARDLPGLYAGADVFCWPSLLEGFGFPVLEAMAQGTPVVTSAGTSTEELTGDAGVLVDPRDPDSIARGIKSVLEDDALARKLSEAGPARAAEYSWDRTASLLADVYKEVA